MRGPLLLACTVAVAAATFLPSSAAQARPQWSAQGQFGVVGEGSGGALWQHTRADLGARVEALYLRETPNDFGVGPYVEARTPWFHAGEYGGGIVALIPASHTYPVWLGVGGFGRRAESAWAPGVDAWIAWGARDFNYEGRYAMAFGLVLDVRRHGGDLPGTDVVASLRIDLEGLALPWIYLLSALVH